MALGSPLVVLQGPPGSRVLVGVDRKAIYLMALGRLWWPYKSLQVLRSHWRSRKTIKMTALGRLWGSFKGLQGLGGGGPQGHQSDGLGVALDGPTWASSV